MKKTFFLILFSAFVLALGTFVLADGGDRHPAYLHALTDLRTARAYLDKMSDSDVVDQKEMDAIAAINKAIGEIKHAAIEDDKNINDHPAVDTTLDRQGRFGKALELLKSARRDINNYEDNPEANHHRKHALQHINNAIKILAKQFRILYPSVKINIGL